MAFRRKHAWRLSFTLLPLFVIVALLWTMNANENDITPPPSKIELWVANGFETWRSSA